MITKEIEMKDRWKTPEITLRTTEYVVVIMKGDEEMVPSEWVEYDHAFAQYSYLLVTMAQKVAHSGGPESDEHPSFSLGIFHRQSNSYIKAVTMSIHTCKEIILQRVEDEFANEPLPEPSPWEVEGWEEGDPTYE